MIIYATDWSHDFHLQSEHGSGEDRAHTSIQIFSRSFRFRGCCWAMWISLPPKNFYWVQVWRQGPGVLGHSRTLRCFSRSHSLGSLAVRFGSRSCWKTHLQCSYWGKEVLAIHGLFHPPLNTLQSCCPLYKKASPKNDFFPPLCFTVGMVFLGLYSSFFFLQTWRVKLRPKSSIFVSSDHMTFWHSSFGSSRLSLANLRWAWTCAGLSKGTLRALQDFNPWQRMSSNTYVYVLLVVFFETVVPAFFRSLTRSCRVVGLILYLPHDHWCSTRWDFAWRPRPREIDSCLEFLPFSNNCTNTCCLLTKLLAYCPVADPSLVQVCNFISDVLTKFSGLGHWGEVGVCLIEHVDRCLLCR